MIKFSSSGDFHNTERFLKRMSKLEIMDILNLCGQRGVMALASATPKESGLTASSWRYEVSVSRSSYEITWSNSHVVDGAVIVILLRYGHGTGTGGYVQGRDFITPAIQPIFDDISERVWKVVTTA